MIEHRSLLEQYLQAKIGTTTRLSITRLEKLRDGWESDNHLLTVESVGSSRTRHDWVWRIFSGVGSKEKAAREFNSLKELFAAGYPVPRAILLEADHSPVDRPFLIMEFIVAEAMSDLLSKASATGQGQLWDQFCRLLAQLHDLDWSQFGHNVPSASPMHFIDRWLDEARRALDGVPEIDGSPMLRWVAARRDLFQCQCPSPSHLDFHPGNILVGSDGCATVIDWTSFDITDSCFDLAWTLVLAHSSTSPGLRAEVLRGYQRHARSRIAHIEAFEAIACTRRLFDVTVSLTHGAERMGMNRHAADAMRASMESHRRVYRLFLELTGLRIAAFANLFGDGP